MCWTCKQYKTFYFQETSLAALSIDSKYTRIRSVFHCEFIFPHSVLGLLPLKIVFWLNYEVRCSNARLLSWEMLYLWCKISANYMVFLFVGYFLCVESEQTVFGYEVIERSTWLAVDVEICVVFDWNNVFYSLFWLLEFFVFSLRKLRGSWMN